MARVIFMYKLLKNIPEPLQAFIAPQMEQLGVAQISGLPNLTQGFIAKEIRPNAKETCLWQALETRV